MYETTQANLGEDHWRGKDLQAVLLDSVAHEWRTPLTSIKASVSALLSDSPLEPSQRDELLVIIEEETDRI
jgi:two-component system sensor histidine kinase KdpD